jgi:peptidoglycan/xylan/chitin deacetylase (PgdA/CDA1 family)
MQVDKVTSIELPKGFESVFSLRIDIETVNCLLKGVPVLLNLLKNYKTKATFFVPMGPDNLSKNYKIKDIPKYLRLEPLKKFGLKNIFHGTLIPSPDFAKLYALNLKNIVHHGHEVGLHGYNHTKWVKLIRNLPDEEVEKLFLKGYNEYIKVYEKKPKAFASPEFMWTEKTLSLLDQYNFLYGSDIRGSLPLQPKIKGKLFKTLQIPVTLPNLEELRNTGMNDRKALEVVCKKIEEKINSKSLGVLLIHPSYEALWKQELLHTIFDYIERNRNRLWIAKMEEVATWYNSQQYPAKPRIEQKNESAENS